jgi:uncharacterized protein (TIGR00730 family)
MEKYKSLISIIILNMFLFANINIAAAADINMRQATLSPQLVLNIGNIQNLFLGLTQDSMVKAIAPVSAADIPEDYEQKITPQFFVDAVNDWLNAQEKLYAIGPAFFIFGSARFNPGHKWYEEAKKFGRIVAENALSIITGGGPGTMLGANQGAYGIEGVDSIGLCMKLPHEKNQDHALFKDVVKFFDYFFIRKIMFIEKAWGGISVPGGFGTLDEIFEILAFNKRYPEKARYNVLVDQAFYSGFIKFLNKIHQRGLMPHHEKLSLTMKDSVEEAFEQLILNTSNLKPKEIDINIKVFMHEIFRASRVLNRVGPSVGIIGGEQMPQNSVYWPMAKRLTKSLSALNMNIIRRGNRGIAAAVSQAYDDFDKTLSVERGVHTALHEDGNLKGYNSADLSLNFEYYYSLKIALIEYSKLGLVVFPGGVDTLDVLFETLCLIKTNKIAAMPIILVGHDFWDEEIEWIKAKMLSEGTINADYLDLIQIVDNEIEAQQIIADNLDLVKKHAEKKLEQVKQHRRSADLNVQISKQIHIKSAFQRIFTEKLTKIRVLEKNNEFNFTLIAQAI